MSTNRLQTRFDQSLPAICRLAAVALLLAAFVGCRSHAPTAHLNPIDPAHALPPVETLDYPGPERFWNKSGLVISPARIVAQVGSEVPMFAGICDGKGQLAPHEQVEWMLDNGGVGSFVSVAEPIRPWCLEVVSKKAHKVDNMYALTETAPANVILTRGTATLNDDMVVPRGYTWVTVTSPVEGNSYITAYGPDVYSWDVRQKSARIIWIDAEWCFPEGACAKVGEPVTLTTCVARRTTKVPVSDWIVKYTITGGVAAGFAPDNAQSVEIATGEDGRASVEVVPSADANGTVCINVELIRSECATPGSPERVSIATAATQVTWGIPDPPPSPPPSAPPTNPAPSAPPSTPNPPTTPPPANPQPTPPVAPQVDLNILGPQTATLAQDLVYSIEVTNKGAAAASGLVLSARFDAGLQHTSGASAINPREIVPAIAAGETRKIPLNLRVLKPGNQCLTVELSTVATDGKLVPFNSKQQCVAVQAPPQQPAALEIEVRGANTASVGQKVLFTIKINNAGDLPAQQVRLSCQLDPTFQLTQVEKTVTKVDRIRPGVDEWNISDIPGHGSITQVIECSCIAPGRGCCKVTVTTGGREPRMHDHCLEVQAAAPGGQSPIGVEIVQPHNPVAVGNNAIYIVKFKNNTKQDDSQVRLSITTPPEMTVVKIRDYNAPDEGKDGNTIPFKPILGMRPGEELKCTLELRADRPIDQTAIRAEVTSTNMPQPQSATKAIQIIPR
jgi:uncharacterized repeat protein (TIGR01451 family)